MSRRTSARPSHTASSSTRVREHDASPERNEEAKDNTLAAASTVAVAASASASVEPLAPLPTTTMPPACFRGTLSLFSSTPDQAAEECHLHPVAEIRLYASNSSSSSSSQTAASTLCQSCTARADQDSNERLLGWNQWHRSLSSSTTKPSSVSLSSTPLPSCCLLSREYPFDAHHLCMFAEIPVADFTIPQPSAGIKTQAFVAMCHGREESFIPASINQSDDDSTLTVTHLTSSAATTPQQPEVPFTPMQLGNRSFLSLLADLRHRKTVGLIHFGGTEFAPSSASSLHAASSHRSPRSFEFGFLFPLSVNTAAIKLVQTAADLAHFFIVHSQLHNRITTRVKRHVLEHYNFETDAASSSSRYSSSTILKQKLNQFDWKATKQQHQKTTTVSLPATSDLISKPVDPFSLLSMGSKLAPIATFPSTSQLFVRKTHTSGGTSNRSKDEGDEKQPSWHTYESLLQPKLLSTAAMTIAPQSASTTGAKPSSSAAAAALISSSSSSSEDENDDKDVDIVGRSIGKILPSPRVSLKEISQTLLADASAFLEVQRPLHRICDFFTTLSDRISSVYQNDRFLYDESDLYIDLAGEPQFPKPARAPLRPPAAASKRFLVFSEHDKMDEEAFETRLVLSLLRRRPVRAELSNLTITTKDSDAEKARKEQVNKDYEEYKKRYVTFQMHIMLLYVFPNATKLDAALLFPTKKSARASTSSSPPRSPNSISVSLETEFKEFVRMLPLSVDKADFIIQVLSIPNEAMMKEAASTMATRDKLVAAVLQERDGGDRGVDPSLAQSIRHWKSKHYAPPISDAFFTGARYSDYTLDDDTLQRWRRQDSVVQLASLAADWDVKPEQNIAKRWMDDWKAFLAEREICQTQPHINESRHVTKERTGAVATKTMSKAEAEVMNKLAKQAFPDSSMADVSLSLPKPGYGKNRGTSKVDIARAVAAAKTAAAEAAAAADAAQAKQRQLMSAPIERSTQCSSLFFGSRSRIQIDTKVRVLKSPTCTKKSSSRHHRTPGSGSGGKGKKRERERTPSGSAKKKAPGSAQKKARLTHSPARTAVAATVAAASSTPVRSSPRLMMQQQLAVGLATASPPMAVGSPAFRSPLRLAHGSPLIIAETPAQESLFHASPAGTARQPRGSARKVARGLDFSGAGAMGSGTAAGLAAPAAGLPRMSSRAGHFNAPKRQLFSSPQKQKEDNVVDVDVKVGSPAKVDKKRTHTSMSAIMTPASSAAAVVAPSSSSSSPASAFASPSLVSPVVQAAVIVQATPSPGDEVPPSNPNSNQSNKSRPSGSSAASGSARGNTSKTSSKPATTSAQRSLFQTKAPMSSLSSLAMRDNGGRAIVPSRPQSQQQSESTQSHESPKKKQKLSTRALSIVAEEADADEHMHDAAQNARITPRKAAREASAAPLSASSPPPSSSLSGLSMPSSYQLMTSTSSPPTVTVQGAASKRVIGVATVSFNTISASNKASSLLLPHQPSTDAMETAKTASSFKDLFKIPSLNRTITTSRNVTKNAPQ